MDWRQDFGGLLKSGDIYYDLAKLNHSLVINHEIINKGLFTIKIQDDVIQCDILRKNYLVVCQEILYKFIIENNFNLEKVKLITSLIWLNMSPLHHYPFNIFLFYFGKWNLWQVLTHKI